MQVENNPQNLDTPLGSINCYGLLFIDNVIAQQNQEMTGNQEDVFLVLTTIDMIG